MKATEAKLLEFLSAARAAEADIQAANVPLAVPYEPEGESVEWLPFSTGTNCRRGKRLQSPWPMIEAIASTIGRCSFDTIAEKPDCPWNGRNSLSRMPSHSLRWRV